MSPWFFVAPLILGIAAFVRIWTIVRDVRAAPNRDPAPERTADASERGGMLPEKTTGSVPPPEQIIEKGRAKAG